jgi:hypothetical protein
LKGNISVGLDTLKMMLKIGEVRQYEESSKTRLQTSEYSLNQNSILNKRPLYVARQR